MPCNRAVMPNAELLQVSSPSAAAAAGPPTPSSLDKKAKNVVNTTLSPGPRQESDLPAGLATQEGNCSFERVQNKVLPAPVISRGSRGGLVGALFLSCTPFLALPGTL